MIILIHISLAPLWGYSDKEKNQEVLKNQIRRALEKMNLNNLLTVAFPLLGMVHLVSPLICVRQQCCEK